MSQYLFWNGSIRFFMEGYLDFILFAMLHIKEMKWDNDIPIVVASNYLSIFFLSLTTFLPIFMIVFWAVRLDRWKKEAFKEKYGSLLEGTTEEFRSRKWAILLIPMIFFLRRLGLAIVCVYFLDFFWAQIAV